MTWQPHVCEAIHKARARLWALHRGISLGWGVRPLPFLRLVRGVIVPLLFYAAPCWAAILGVETCLIELDRVMALASHMAFGPERSTSIEASLVMGGLGLARMHIARALVRYLCKCRCMSSAIALPSMSIIPMSPWWSSAMLGSVGRFCDLRPLIWSILIGKYS